MTTWLDVFSDAVKIGLGAVISASSGYLVLKSNQNDAEKREKAQRIREDFQKLEIKLSTVRFAVSEMLLASYRYVLNKGRTGFPESLKIEYLNKMVELV